MPASSGDTAATAATLPGALNRRGMEGLGVGALIVVSCGSGAGIDTSTVSRNDVACWESNSPAEKKARSAQTCLASPSSS